LREEGVMAGNDTDDMVPIGDELLAESVVAGPGIPHA
jgi:hypothetical protein